MRTNKLRSCLCVIAAALAMTGCSTTTPFAKAPPMNQSRNTMNPATNNAMNAMARNTAPAPTSWNQPPANMNRTGMPVANNAAPVIPATTNALNPNAAPAMPGGMTTAPAGMNQPSPMQPASYQMPAAVPNNANQSNASPYSGTSMSNIQKPVDPLVRPNLPATTPTPAPAPTPEGTSSSSMLPQPVQPPMDVPPMQAPVPSMTPMPRPTALPSPQALTPPNPLPNSPSIPPAPVPLPVRARPQE
jgi:hypothetical protein